MRKSIVILAGVAFTAVVCAAVLLVPNPLGNYLISEAKANGYLEYKPDEALRLARTICTQCHTDERIKLYCPRCGPPFVAVVPHMQTFIDNYKKTKPNIEFINITEPQAVAIVQVWNALVGNWEADFREQDILKLIGHYDRLAKLYKTPVEQRKIEYALMQRDDLKIGHMTPLMEMQKDLGKPENNPGGPPAKTGGADHSGGGSNMKEDHNHGEGHDHSH